MLFQKPENKHLHLLICVSKILHHTSYRIDKLIMTLPLTGGKSYQYVVLLFLANRRFLSMMLKGPYCADTDMRRSGPFKGEAE